jgi:hypothetical protein
MRWCKGVDNSNWTSGLNKSKVALDVKLEAWISPSSTRCETSGLDKSKVALGVRIHHEMV